MNAVLEVKDLTKIYPSFTLDHVSFDLTAGRITGFIGRNGAGKTTTLHSLLGFLSPDGGEVRFWGQDIRGHAPEIKQRVGFVSAGMTFYNKKKLRTITEITRSFYERWDEDVYRRYLELFDLEEEKTPEKLSNGMKIKYMLSLAMSHGADLLILDEPTSGLDPVSREELLEIFLGLRDAGKTILFSTHITSDLDKTADDILYISGGKLLAQAPLDEFIGSWRLAEYGPDALAPEEKELLTGQRRARNGFTALVRARDAQRLSVPVRTVNLEEIMVHLEKEA